MAKGDLQQPERSRPDDPNAWPPGWDKPYPKDVYDGWRKELDSYFDTWVDEMAATMKKVEAAEAERAKSKDAGNSSPPKG